MRSMPVVNNLHNENRPKRHTSDIRPHKRNKTKRGREKKKKQTSWNIKLNHQPKKRQRRRSFILGDSNWKFFQVGYPVDTSTKKHSHCSPTCREKTLQVSSPLPHKHTRTSILQLQLSCMLSSDMTRICELIVSAPVYDGYVWLGVEISNNSQLSCKTFGGRCLVLHRTLQL